MTLPVVGLVRLSRDSQPAVPHKDRFSADLSTRSPATTSLPDQGALSLPIDQPEDARRDVPARDRVLDAVQAEDLVEAKRRFAIIKSLVRAERRTDGDVRKVAAAHGLSRATVYGRPGDRQPQAAFRPHAIPASRCQMTTDRRQIEP